MQRRKAITTAASISLALFSAATAMAVNTGLLLSPPTKGVGQLNAVTADALGPAPTTMPPAPPQTIIVTVPRSAVSGAAPAATSAPAATIAPLRQAPAAVPSPTVAIAPASKATTSTTVRSTRTSTTVRGENDEHDDEDEDEDEDDRPTTSTRPSGGEDDD